jgi:hypothetical protein
MSVTFAIGNRVSTNLDDPWITLSNQNAADLLLWLGLPANYLVGEVLARELAARCRRRLWPEPRNMDGEVPPEFCSRFYSFGRPIGYLRQRAAELLHLAELAGDGVISWA